MQPETHLSSVNTPTLMTLYSDFFHSAVYSSGLWVLLSDTGHYGYKAQLWLSWRRNKAPRLPAWGLWLTVWGLFSKKLCDMLHHGFLNCTKQRKVEGTKDMFNTNMHVTVNNILWMHDKGGLYTNCSLCSKINRFYYNVWAK